MSNLKGFFFNERDVEGDKIAVIYDITNREDIHAVHKKNQWGWTLWNDSIYYIVCATTEWKLKYGELTNIYRPKIKNYTHDILY